MHIKVRGGKEVIYLIVVYQTNGGYSNAAMNATSAKIPKTIMIIGLNSGLCTGLVALMCMEAWAFV